MYRGTRLQMTASARLSGDGRSANAVKPFDYQQDQHHGYGLSGFSIIAFCAVIVHNVRRKYRRFLGVNGEEVLSAHTVSTISVITGFQSILLLSILCIENIRRL